MFNVADLQYTSNMPPIPLLAGKWESAYNPLLPFLPCLYSQEILQSRIESRIKELSITVLAPVPLDTLAETRKRKPENSPPVTSAEPPPRQRRRIEKIASEHFQFGSTPTPLYPLSAPADIKESVAWLRYNASKGRVVESVSTVISLFGKPFHIAFSINYIANIVLFGLKMSVNWVKDLVPALGIFVGGIELIKEILDTKYIYKTSQRIDALRKCLPQKLPELKEQIETDLAYQKLLGKKVIKLLLDKIEGDDPNKIQQIDELLHTQLKKAKIVHGISIACLALTVASFLTTMFLAPFTVLFGVSASYTAISFARTALLKCYLYEPGHKFVPKKMIPPLIRKRIFPMVMKCFGSSSSSHSSSTPSQKAVPAPISPLSKATLKP